MKQSKSEIARTRIAVSNIIVEAMSRLAVLRHDVLEGIERSTGAPKPRKRRARGRNLTAK